MTMKVEVGQFQFTSQLSRILDIIGKFIPLLGRSMQAKGGIIINTSQCYNPYASPYSCHLLARTPFRSSPSSILRKKLTAKSTGIRCSNPDQNTRKIISKSSVAHYHALML